MADLDREHPQGITDIRKTQASTTQPGTPESGVNYHSVTSLRTRLAAISAGFYTAARLNQMTKNDMVYAVRVADDAAGIR